MPFCYLSIRKKYVCSLNESSKRNKMAQLYKHSLIPILTSISTVKRVQIFFFKHYYLIHLYTLQTKNVVLVRRAYDIPYYYFAEINFTSCDVNIFYIRLPGLFRSRMFSLDPGFGQIRVSPVKRKWFSR